MQPVRMRGGSAMSFKIRAAGQPDARDIAKVQVDSWRTTYKGIVSDDYLSALDYKKREEVWEAVVTQNNTFLLIDGDGSTVGFAVGGPERSEDRKSTRLNSSHVAISYAVFCLKK